MKKFVQIYNNIVITLLDEHPGDNVLGDIIDVTKIKPSPALDWLYDSDTKTFSSQDIDVIKQNTINNINITADVMIKKHNAINTNKAWLYTQKVSEARGFLLENKISNYPLIALESKISGATPKTIANTIITKHNKHLAVVLDVEKIRLTAKIAINKTSSANNITKIEADAIESLNILGKDL